MKNLIYITLFALFICSCSNDDVLTENIEYGFNIEVLETSLGANNWSDISVKNIRINLPESENDSDSYVVVRETGLSSQYYDYDNFDGVITFTSTANSVELNIDPLNHTGYFDFIISISKNNFTKYFFVSSNINSENKQILTMWESKKDNLDPVSGNITLNSTFEDHLFEGSTFTNTDGQLFNDFRVVSDIENTNNVFGNVYSTSATDIILWRHSEIN